MDTNEWLRKLQDQQALIRMFQSAVKSKWKNDMPKQLIEPMEMAEKMLEPKEEPVLIPLSNAAGMWVETDDPDPCDRHYDAYVDRKLEESACIL